jgi:hypothetical protein
MNFYFEYVIEPEVNDIFTAEYSLEAIRKLVFSIEHNKAPGRLFTTGPACWYAFVQAYPIYVNLC